MSGSFFTDLQERATTNADQTCLVLADGATLTYGQVYERAGRFATALSQAGVTAGDRVVVQVDKSPSNLALYLAVLQIGAVYVPLNTAYTPAELAYFVDDAQPSVFVGSSVDESLSQQFPQLVQLTLRADETGTLAEQAQQVQPLQGCASRESSDLAAIVYTSGTTGRSKGAMLSHHNLRSNAQALVEAWGWQADDVLLHALPIFHVHGLFIAMHCALLTATPMIFLPRFVSSEVARWLPDATVLMGVPTFYTRLLDEPSLNTEHVASVRVFICGSAPLTPQTFDAFEARTGHRILERYGMSETIINTSNPLNGERVPGTVGFPLPGVEVCITDDDGRALAADTIGMIEVRGENVFGGYWRKPEKTAEELRSDGWFITGDLGTLDEVGRLSIVGRSKDLVISGGYNVYPKEVEKVLDDLPEIVESAVIGVPHNDFGEAVVAVVVPQNEAVSVEMMGAALGEQLAKFKQPKAIINVDALPRNTMGKVQKNILRDAHKGLFTSSESGG